MSDIVSIPIIVALVYAFIEIFKSIVKKEEKYMRFIPLLAGGLGAILSVIAFYAVPGIVPAHNVLSAILIGIASGLSATGTHQIFKQLSANN